MTPSQEMHRVLRWAGLLTGLIVAAPPLIEGVSRPAGFMVWLGGLVTFGALYVWSTSPSRLGSPSLTLRTALAGQAACVAVMASAHCRGLEGTLLVLVAMELGLSVPRRTGLPWVAVQSLGLFAGILVHWGPRSALLFTPPYLGFQVVAFLVVELLGREARASAELARTNAELVSTRKLLAESARLGERLRIARELHDSMGHHLAGLSLNLEVLAQRQGPSQPLDVARSLTRRLLDDVESVVDALVQDRGIDLSRALATLASEIPRPRIHVEAEPLALPDPERAHALLRCCQEIVTNAVKHANAENVWIAIHMRGEQVELTAHDDGSGAARLAPGTGLEGMRRRLEEMGGALDLETRPGSGFHVKATLPGRPG